LVQSGPRNVLVLAPHPDDETFGCGGTIGMLTSSGIAVDVAFLTRGEQGVEGGPAVSREIQREMAQTRTWEAEAACRLLGVREVFFLNGADTALRDHPELATAIAELLAKHAYQRVFCPWPRDGHDDHEATFQLLAQATTSSRASGQFWLYEVWKPLPENTFVPIDHTMGIKRQAMEQYRSQLAQLNYAEGFAGLASYRSLFCPGSKYAEAFLVCDQNELLRL
jgi:N-acetylglucosamine malate deacetylase 1